MASNTFVLYLLFFEIILLNHSAVSWLPLFSLLDKHAPVLITRFSSRKSKSNPWFTSTLRAFKSTVCHAENIWKRTHSALDWSAFKSLRKRYHNLILASKKKQYYANLVSSSSDNPWRLWQTTGWVKNRTIFEIRLQRLTIERHVICQKFQNFI